MDAANVRAARLDYGCNAATRFVEISVLSYDSVFGVEIVVWCCMMSCVWHVFAAEISTYIFLKRR
jgi:hypothetical protein